MLLFGFESGSYAIRLGYTYAKDTSCPQDTPFGSHGNCVGCNSYEALTIAKGHEKDFEICSNRMIIAENSPFQAQSILKESILKECPAEAPMRDHKNSCISCDTTYPVYTEDCQKCTNRELLRNTKCVLKECPADKPLKSDGDCLSCDQKGLDLSVTQEMCEKCSNTYKWYQERCIPIMSASKDYPLVDLDMSFHVEDWWHREFWRRRCDVLEPITTIKESCDQCPNRKYIDGECVLIK